MTDKTATEMLNAPKAFTMLMTGLGVIQERIEWMAGFEGRVVSLQRVEAAAIEGAAQAQREAAETRAACRTECEADRAAARTEVKRELDQAAVIAAENDRERGETSELQARKATLVSAVARLTKTVADLEAIR